MAWMLTAAWPAHAGGCAPGANLFCVVNTADSGVGSLRQAIIDANASTGASTIGFDIPGSGVQTITLASQLPAINAAGTLTSLLIDGFSQPGSVPNTNAPDQGGLDAQLMIEVVGSGGYGFLYDCCGHPYLTLTFQGLALHGFINVISGQSNTTTPKAKLIVYGCYIGTKIDGTALPSLGNSSSAVNVGNDDAQIGGTLSWQRNLLSGNGGAGVYGGGPNDTVVVEGNLIGTDASGTGAIPNGGATNWPGIVVQGNLPGLRIGCTGAGCTGATSRNVISGNYTFGIGVWDSYGTGTGGLQIKGNYIGTDWTGTQHLSNGNVNTQFTQYGGGIQLQGSPSAFTPATVIGGSSPGEANVIAYNLGPGITGYGNYPGASFDAQGNEIHHNRGVGFANIDIGSSGPTANDVDDADTGTNDLQNWPGITAFSLNGNQLNVTYLVDSTTANSTYPLRIDFYANVQGGSGILLAQDSYPASSAQQPRSVTLTVPAGAHATSIVATATNADGHTSEFSPAFDVIFEDSYE